MPANKSGDSKQGLIIALVVACVLVLVFGITTYLGYADKDKLEKEAADAKKGEKSAQADRDYYKARAILSAAYIGGPMAKDELEDLATVRGKFEGGQVSGANREVFAKSVSNLDKELGWNPTQMKPQVSLREKLDTLTSTLDQTQKKLAATEALLKKAQANYEETKKTLEGEVDEWRKKYETAQKTYVEDIQKKAKELEDRLAEFGDLSKQVETLKKSKEADTTALDKDKRRLEGMVKNLEENMQKLKNQLTPPDLFKADVPKGKILRLDRSGELAWINLGSADNIRDNQNLTFSIFNPGTAERSGSERKGAVEVVRVEGPHLSVARVTEVVEPNRNPLAPGDVLVNPAWSPTAQMHVAIVGLIDLTGDGRDSSDEFRRNLTKEGIVVDAWLDLRKLKLEGDGITNKTDFLILGDQPKFEDQSVIREGDQVFEYKKAALDKIATVEADAKTLGVTVVPLRKFVAMTGYRMPQGAANARAFTFDRRSNQAPGETREGSKKEKGPSKEESKDDSDK